MAVTLLAAALAVLPGCGASSSSSSPQTGSGAPSAASTSPGAAASTSYYAKDRGNAQFAMGTTVVITRSGFQPQQLLAPVGYAIVWKNLSGSTQSVHLDNFGSRVDSGPIPPGGSWSFNPKAQLSIVYHSTYHPRFHGQLQVQQVGNQ